jgi:hypothetical protein
MLRTLLIASTLLAASGTAFAHGDYSYGRVVTVEPRFVISFGVRQADGFSILYESGGSRYWTYSPYRPGRTIVLPPPYRIQHAHHYRDYGGGWDNRRDWDDRRDGWRDDRRDHRRDYREHRRHDRHDHD